MTFQDRSPVAVEPDDILEGNDSLKEEKRESQNMWDLMKPEPRGDAFASLLAGGGGKEYKYDAKFAPRWDLAALKPFVPLPRSRSSLRNDSLQLCTEGLGCESCNCLLDSASSSSASSSVMADDLLAEDDEEIEDEFEEEEEFEEKEAEFEEKNIHPARSFPPPLRTLSASSSAHLRSFKKDGRFVLQSVKAPLQNFVHSHREGGRLKMHLVSTTEDDDLALPLAPKPQNEELPEEIEEGFGEDQGSNAVFSEILVLHQANLLPESSSANQSGSSSKCNKSPAPRELIKVACCKPREKCKGIDNETSNGKREIQEGKSYPKSCQNIYSGWRSEIGEQNSAVFCQNWQKAQDLPNYPLNKLRYAEAVSVMNVHANVNDHARFSKFRVNDLGLARCHDANSLSVWGKYPCIATSS